MDPLCGQSEKGNPGRKQCVSREETRPALPLHREVLRLRAEDDYQIVPANIVFPLPLPHICDFYQRKTSIPGILVFWRIPSPLAKEIQFNKRTVAGS
jgi:hypothetical protein